MLTLSGFVESVVRLFISASHILKLLFPCHSCIYRMFEILKTVLPTKGSTSQKHSERNDSCYIFIHTLKIESHCRHNMFKSARLEL